MTYKPGDYVQVKSQSTVGQNPIWFVGQVAEVKGTALVVRARGRQIAMEQTIDLAREPQRIKPVNA